MEMMGTTLWAVAYLGRKITPTISGQCPASMQVTKVNANFASVSQNGLNRICREAFVLTNDNQEGN